MRQAIRPPPAVAAVGRAHDDGRVFEISFFPDLFRMPLAPNRTDQELVSVFVRVSGNCALEDPSSSCRCLSDTLSRYSVLPDVSV